MNRLEPEGLKQSPMKKVNHTPKKVEATGDVPQINDSVNWLDAIRLFVGKKIQNAAFGQYEASIGKSVVMGSSAIGGVSLMSINWALLLTGNVFEIIKAVVAVVSFVLAWFWKK